MVVTRLPLVVGIGGGVEEDVVREVLGDVADFVADPTEQELSRAEGAIVRAAPVLDAPFFDTHPALRVVARSGVGYERVDVAAATAHSVVVAITPGSAAHAVAEGVFAHALFLVKNLRAYHRAVQEDRFAAGRAIVSGDLEGSVIGLLGCGRIGRQVSDIAKAFGAEVLIYDPYLKNPVDGQVATLDELLTRSDIVSLHAPLTPETRGVINRQSLARMKAGAILINLARSPLVDPDAVLESLRHGHLGGYGVDVFEPEPPAHHPLFDDDRVLLTPHMMGLSRSASRATFTMAAQAVRAVLTGGRPDYPVN